MRITRYGTFEVRQEMPAHDRKAGATGVTKLMTIVDPYLLERTSRLEARLCRRFGIRASVQTLSEYLRRHEAEIFGGRRATVPMLTAGKWLLTIYAPGAKRVEATFVPFTPPARKARAVGKPETQR